MKQAILFLCLCTFGSCTKKCSKQLTIDYGTCITDSTHIASMLIGTWDLVEVVDHFSNSYSNPCYSGISQTYQFDNTGNYKHFENGVLLHQGQYSLKGDTTTVIYDSVFLNTGCGICNGYLGIRAGVESDAFYSKRN